MNVSLPFRIALPLVLAAGAWLAASAAAPGQDDPHAGERREMVRTVEDDVRLYRRAIGREQLDSRVLDVLARVPRHEFVPPGLASYAYQNRPLAIGHGQTISQPYIVAVMTDLLEPDPDHTVLEVGTGSGYQAAVLAELVAKVYTVEIVPPLGEAATKRLARLGYDNVVTRVGDGYYGWPEHAPFDAIIVTAAAGHIPPPLIEQLAPGGRMVIPVGGPFMTQQLVLVRKTKDSELRTRQVQPVVFVPLTGGH